MEYDASALGNKLNKAQALAEALAKRLKLHEVFGLPKSGKLTVRHIKPSGVVDGDFKRYRTEIVDDQGAVLCSLSMSDFTSKMGETLPFSPHRVRR